MKALADALRNIGGALVVMGAVVAGSLVLAVVGFAAGMWS